MSDERQLSASQPLSGSIFLREGSSEQGVVAAGGGVSATTPPPNHVARCLDANEPALNISLSRDAVFQFTVSAAYSLASLSPRNGEHTG